MLNYVVTSLFKHFMNLEIEVISMMVNRTTCETNCKLKDGHLPYVFEGRGFSELQRSHRYSEMPIEVENVLDKIFAQNNSFDDASFPNLRIHHRRSGMQ